MNRSADIKEIGKLVRKRRNELRMSQEALAEAALGNSDRKGYISDFEQGKKKNPTLETISKILTALEIAPNQLPHDIGISVSATETSDHHKALPENKYTLPPLHEIAVFNSVTDGEIPDKVVEAFSVRYDSINSAKRLVARSSVRLKQSNPEAFTHRQLTIGPDELPLVPSDLLDLWFQILQTAKSKSRRTLAALLYEDEVILRSALENDIGEYSKDFVEKLIWSK